MSHVLVPPLSMTSTPQSVAVSPLPGVNVAAQTEVQCLNERIVALEAKVHDQAVQMDTLLRLHESLRREVATQHSSFPLVAIDPVHPKAEASPTLAPVSFPLLDPPRAASPINSLLVDVVGVAGVPVEALQPLDELAGLALIELHHTPRTLPLQHIDPGEEPRPILASLPAPPADSPTDTGSALASLGQYDDHDIEMDQTVAQALTPVTAQLQSHFDDMVV